jgi:hypothetical protein
MTRPTLQSGATRPSRRRIFRAGWLDWPCEQSPGRNPEGRRRAPSARDDRASANRVLSLQGQTFAVRRRPRTRAQRTLARCCRPLRTRSIFRCQDVRTVVPLAVLLLAATVAAATASGRRMDRYRAVRAPNAARCGGTLWRMKTMSDIQRRSVSLFPAGTEIGTISKRPHPRPTPRDGGERRTSAIPGKWSHR